MSKPDKIILGPYSPSNRVPKIFTKPSRVKSEFQAECDINNVMRRYEKTGILEHVREGGSYGDFTNATDYQTALNAVIDAQQSFSNLSAQLRKRFANDPAEFLAFIEDEENRDEAIRLGLIDDPDDGPHEPQGRVNEAPQEPSPPINENSSKKSSEEPKKGSS